MESNFDWIKPEFTKDLVSVIIPTYNRMEFLREAIESIIAQTYRPIECIVVDDGSTDHTETIVSNINSTTDESFTLKYIYQANAGAQVARNTGTKASTGAFIQYLDSDDLLYPEKIEKQVDYLMSHPECDGIFGDWQVGSVEKNETIIAYRNDDLIEQMLIGRCIHTLSFLMRRTIVEKIGDWDVSIKRNQEIDFHLRGILVGGKFDYQPGLCGLWRQHTGDRIVSSQALKPTQFFFEKWERKLAEKKLLSSSLARRLSNLYKWIIEVNTGASLSDILSFYQQARKLNPSFKMFTGGKYHLISRIIGEKRALRFWHINRNKYVNK